MTPLILISCTLFTVMLAASSAIECPQMCDCRQPSDQSLTVDCGGRDVNESALSQELNVMLSDEKIRGRLTSLQISNTPLTRVPASVCRMSVLASLNLDNNRVIGLPDNCFTNMTRLQTLSARSNNITELQDGLFDSLHSLRELYFGSNSIASIGLNLFSNPNNLLNLRRIMLVCDHSIRGLTCEVFTDRQTQQSISTSISTTFPSSRTTSTGNSTAPVEVTPTSVSEIPPLGT